MEKQFTATVYIFNSDNQVLLHCHKKFQNWLAAGGHLEANETPPEAARREVLEETGLEIEFITQENIWVEQGHIHSIERPYLCLLENIPAYKESSAHQHIDFIYLARPRHPYAVPFEGFRWFSLEEIERLKPGVDIFEEIIDIIKNILTPNNLLINYKECINNL